MNHLDSTHDPSRRSWVDSANQPGADFPIQNLPLGVGRRSGDDQGRIMTAIGDRVLDLAGSVETGHFGGLDPAARRALTQPDLNALMTLGPDEWRGVRQAISDLLAAESETLRDDADARNRLLLGAGEVEMLMPARVGDYTDFYASLHHATNVGSMFRPDNPLMPNYKHLPVGYHGRASSLVASGTPIRRPSGQTRADDADPTYGPSRLLDYELEMGVFVGGSNEMGRPITMREVGSRLFGVCIVNDWSARDVQKWEYQPLGPFNAKNFATTVCPWIVTMDALAPYRIAGPPRGTDDPPILPYLQSVDDWGLDITVQVEISSAGMRASGQTPTRISRGSFSDMFWTFAQMLVHHASTGCNMRPGDLLASGTVSGPGEDARGCLLEKTWRGQHPIQLGDGSERKFLQDGDEVVISAWCERDDAVRIGFGSCRGVIEPAHSSSVSSA